MIRQLTVFLIHLRLHYQFLILSGGYLLAALYVEQPDWGTYWGQFLNVHILLFGGATAYNSWWDKDEGPIGGLKNPPEMKSWMWMVSMGIQYVGMIFALKAGVAFLAFYLISMLLFWLYSTPLARWKGKPILSLIAIGLSTGTNSFLMGYLAAGGLALTVMEWVTALGVALILLSLYPVSQVFQIQEDEQRGDVTFASRFGLSGVKWLFSIFFMGGSLIISLTLFQQNEWVGMLFGGVSILAFGVLSYFVWSLKGADDEYPIVMKIKFLASFSFVLFILANLGVRFFV